MKGTFRSSLHAMGRVVSGFLSLVGGMTLLGCGAFSALRNQKKKGLRATLDVVISQTLFTGVEALPLVAGISLLIGIIIIVQSMTTMPKLGAGDYFGKILVLVVIRELGPLLTAVIVIGRSGSALAAYIGNMKVNQEIDALEVMGINPVKFIVMPAVLGGIISMVCLTLFFDVVAIFGGYTIILFGKMLNVAAFRFDLPLNVFLAKIVTALATKDLLVSFFKCIMFSITFTVIACYQGLHLAPSFTEVPKATRKAVVQSLVVTMLFNSIITVIFYAYAA